MIQEQIDQERLKRAVLNAPNWKRELLLEDIIAQVCWHGPVTREWLEKEWGLKEEVK